ncbi:hypothetical protein BT96DRAFT_1019176 [Gymnopus androsaceus JB14]|uniref:Uncharacterized protein n=1 Tax=Gymnopus androsaceus JB14 TaxID=1447944 RepID=A0A6A4HQP8_9AGAR|nr:hypothetical protein BT96DRAFT_1019176 [Gymnopus androsaceus JB14]
MSTYFVDSGTIDYTQSLSSSPSLFSGIKGSVVRLLFRNTAITVPDLAKTMGMDSKVMTPDGKFTKTVNFTIPFLGGTAHNSSVNTALNSKSLAFPRKFLTRSASIETELACEHLTTASSQEPQENGSIRSCLRQYLTDIRRMEVPRYDRIYHLCGQDAMTLEHPLLRSMHAGLKTLSADFPGSHILSEYGNVAYIRLVIA